MLKLNKRAASVSLITREIKSIFTIHVAFVNTELGNLPCKYLSKRNLKGGVIESL